MSIIGSLFIINDELKKFMKHFLKKQMLYLYLSDKSIQEETMEVFHVLFVADIE